MNRSAWLIVVGALVLGAGASAVLRGGGAAPAQAPAEAAESNTAPDFTLPDPDGKVVRLSDLKGKVVVLSFWATWCPPCRLEMPHLEALAKKYQDKPVKVLGVNLDVSGPELKQWMEKNKLTFTVVSDKDGSVASRYGVKSIPTLLLLDQTLSVKEQHAGFDPNMERNLGAKIDALLKK